MTKLHWINLCQIITVCYINIFIIAINGKSILFGKSILELNGNIKIPVFVPISWLITDIHSAKMIGQKSDATDMMTSDMTPDMNGNFEKQPTDEKRETSRSDPRITNRVSETQAFPEMPKIQDFIGKEEHSKDRPQKEMEDTMMESEAEMRLKLESKQQKHIATQRFRDEIMYEPDVWPKEVDPLFTTIEIFELPGSGNYMGLESNRTTVHTAPDQNSEKKDEKKKIRLKTSKLKKLHPKMMPRKQSKVKDTMTTAGSKVMPKIIPQVKVFRHTNNNNNNNNYFKNYLKENKSKNKFNN